ncbi:ATG4D protease, partial [Circaetus pectoralis]|nr:ATG4D protease [Circaetus pectoralis]
GWTVRPKTHFNKLSPLHLLGRAYRPAADEELDRFQRDFSSRLWLTYRRGFPPLAGTPWSTDCGWGCMLRTAQMLLAQGLVLHLLGRDWMWSEAMPEVETAAGSWRARDPPGGTRDPPGGTRDPPGWTRDPPGGTRDLLGQARDPPGGTQEPPGRTRDPPGWTQDPPARTRDPPAQTRDPPGRTQAPPAWTRDPPGRAG